MLTPHIRGLIVGLLIVGVAKLASAQTVSPPLILVSSGVTTAPDGSVYILDSVMFPVISASGQIAFRATLLGTSSPTGVIAGAPGSLQIVARQGDAAPAGGTFSTLAIPCSTRTATWH